MKKSAVYTKTGDKGTTSLVGGQRVSKSHIRLEAYGTIDELNSFIGLLMCSIHDQSDRKVLSFIQNKLFNIGSYLATDASTTDVKNASLIADKDINLLEFQIDEIDSQLPPLSQFVLPGGCESAARAHICRTVCRRAERLIFKITNEYAVDEDITIFVNRLSDYFFLLARKECNKNGKEIYWNQKI